MTPLLRSRLLLLAGAFVVAGCHHAHSPTVDVFGSYFPAWIICILAGLFLTIITRQLFIGLKLAPHVRPAPLVYLCFMVSYTFLVWLLFFKN